MNAPKELGTAEEYKTLTDTVPPKWRGEFRTFVTSGIASDEFLAFLDSDERAQQAVEAAVSDEVRNFNRFAQSLNIDPELIENYLKRKKRKPLDIARGAASKIVAGLLEAVSLKPRDRRQAVNAISAAIPADQSLGVVQLLAELSDDINGSVPHSALEGAHLKMNPSR